MNLSLPRGFWIRLWYLPGFLFLTVFSFGFLKVDFLPEITFRVLFGFVFFLQDASPFVPIDLRKILLAVLGFAVATALVHGLLQRRARRSGRAWSLGRSFALVTLPLLLLAAAFPVPRTLRQLNRVVVLPWKLKDQYHPGSRAGYALEVLRQGVIDDAALRGGEFPGSLDKIDPTIRRQFAWVWTVFADETPAESFVYLGAGLRMESDPSLPLLISAPFEWADIPSRGVITVGGELKKIRAEEIDSWIGRSLEGRLAMRAPEPDLRPSE